MEKLSMLKNKYKKNVNNEDINLCYKQIEELKHKINKDSYIRALQNSDNKSIESDIFDYASFIDFEKYIFWLMYGRY